MSAVPVNVDNFVRAESDRMFAAVAKEAGGTGILNHNREPTPLDIQPIIRMNRDTLYSAAILDISQGAELEIPDAGDRYVSVMIVNQDHYINKVFHAAGKYKLETAEFGSEFVLLAARILVDPENPADVAEVNALQDELRFSTVSARQFELPDYEQTSFNATRNALLELAKGLGGLDRCFGKKEDVDPVRHLVSSAAAWGGLPEAEATYINVAPDLPVGKYSLTVGQVPVDGFWSLSLYNAEGFFEENSQGVYSVNNITGVPNPDGTITINFGGDPEQPNALPIMEGWNYLVRLYRPRAEVLDGTWSFPAISN